MSEQLLVFDRNTGKGWAIARRYQNGNTLPENGAYLDSFDGVPAVCSAEKGHEIGEDFPLTPLPADHQEAMYRKLGKAVYESVPEKLRPRLTGEFRVPEDGERIGFGPVTCFTQEEAYGRVNPGIILATEEPKRTDMEVLEEIVTAWNNGDLYDTLTRAKQHIEEQE